MDEPERAGFVAGHVVIDDGHGQFNLRQQIWTSSPATQVDCLTVVERSAAYVLLIEKKSIFDRLMSDEFHAANRCILATGGGYLGTRFRAILRVLHEQLKLPFYVLADNDRAGYLFYFLMARGNVRTRSKGRPDLAIAEARYLGLTAADAATIPDMGQIDLSKNEINELERLKACPCLISDPIWQHEFDHMLRHGFKTEMEAVITLGVSYLAETYLPEKVAADQCLRWNGV